MPPSVGGMDTQFAAGRDFIMREGRLLERRLFATCFEDAPAAGVVDALKGYRNDDGGFGHGLEPDVRCPSSLPIGVETALKALVAAGTTDVPLVLGACDYLAGVAAAADQGGAVPPALAVIEAYPRAVHWSDWTYVPSLNPTAGLVGLLGELKVDHPWMKLATSWCWEQIDGRQLPGDAHALGEVLIFLEHAADAGRAGEAATRVRERLDTAEMFHANPDDEGYGLSPLFFAPMASSKWRSLFSEDMIQAHLDKLQSSQQADGGWAITWEPPSEASRLDWRGIVTLDALRTLHSYGRLDSAG
jgi:hypothetical protein